MMVRENPDAWLARIQLLAEQLKTAADELMEVVQVERDCLHDPPKGS